MEIIPDLIPMVARGRRFCLDPGNDVPDKSAESLEHLVMFIAVTLF